MPVEVLNFPARRWITTVGLVATLSLAAVPARAGLPGEQVSPPGQVVVLALNARQQRAVDLVSFQRLFQLVKAIRSRPTAFDGGFANATAMPDIIIFEEMKESNLEIIKRLLNQRTRFEYDIVSADPQAKATFLVNTKTMTSVADPQVVIDPCRDGTNGEAPARYQVARLTETASGQEVTIGGVHFLAKYQGNCRQQNAQAMKIGVVAEIEPVIIGGDFNQRPVAVPLECDPNERSDAEAWWSYLTHPNDGTRPFVDAVRDFNRARDQSFAEEWTFSRAAASKLCNGTHKRKKSRLDYLFAAGAEVAEAHADHPGWTGEPHKSFAYRHPYSDHRWVWGRFVIRGPARPAPPKTSLARAGKVQLSWQAEDGVTEWVVYRGEERHGYKAIARLPADQTSYDDVAEDGVKFRYAVAPVAADGAQGRESRSVAAIPDARGPHVVAISPPEGSPNAPRTSSIHVWFDEHVAPESVSQSTIRVIRKGRPVAGRVSVRSGLQLRFNPKRWLKNEKVYSVVVHPVRDRFGNVGPRFTASFST